MIITQKPPPVSPRACSACPWRLSNQDKQDDPHKFYTPAYIRRLWTGLRSGDAPGMSCHPTDPRMAQWEGYEKNAELTDFNECTGSVVMILREVMRFQAICNDIEAEKETGLNHRHDDAIRRYRMQTVRTGMTRENLANWVFMLATDQKRFPTVDAILDNEIGAPCAPEWDESILQRAQT